MNVREKAYNKEDEFDLGFIFRQAHQKWKLYVYAFLLFSIAGFFYMKFTLPVYQANSSVLIEDSKSSSGNFEDILSSDLFGANLNIPTEVGILRSRSVFNETIGRLGLEIQYWGTNHLVPRPLYPKTPFSARFDTIVNEFREYPFKVTIINDESFELDFEYDGDALPHFHLNRRYRFGEKVVSPYFSFQLTRIKDFKLKEESSFEFRVRSLNKLIAQMLENFTAEPLEKDANIVAMTYRDVIPSRAMDVLNTIGRVYIDRDVRDKAEVASLTLRFVDEQLANTGSALSDTEQKLQDFKEKNKTVDLSEQSKAVLTRVNELDVERLKNNIEIASLQNLYDYIVKNEDLTPLAPSSLGIPDPLLVQLITNCQALQARRKSLLYGVKTDAPAVKVLDQQIAENRAALIENVKSIQKRMQISYKSIKDQLDEFESQIKNVPEMERELLVIKRNVEVNQNIYTYLLQKKAETSIARATVVSDNKILDNSALLDEPVEPNKKAVAAIILLLSFFLPTGYILGRAFLRTTVLNKEDIASITTVPLIGVVGHSDEEGSNLVVHNRPKSVIAEGFRTVRTNLKFYKSGAGCTTILITSSVGGEGKSFVTLNLATIMALQQQKVIIVGLDLRKPKLYQDFGWTNDSGASSFLAGAASLQDVIRKSSIPNLDLIISGPIPPNPAELLSRPALKEMFDELKTRYDVIIIDTPPIGVVADGYLVMPNADINLYLVRQGYSKLEYLRTFDELCKDGKIKNVGILLNDSDFSNSYGYGYGHNYGYVKGNSGYYDMEEHKESGNIWSRIFGRKSRS